MCENILNLVELLIDMGVMKQCLRDEITGSIAGKAIYMYFIAEFIIECVIKKYTYIQYGIRLQKI